MLDISRDIDSLSNFKRNTGEFIQQMKETGQPVVLTIHGKAEVVVQDAKSYQRLLEATERAEAIAGIRRGLESIERGEGVPLEEAAAKIRRKHRIQKDA
jgi:prevent-host-death family protein